MTVVVLGQHYLQGPQASAQPPGRPPAEVGRVAPPHVQLTQAQAQQCPGPRKMPYERSDGEIRHRAEKAVEQDGRIRRDDGVIEVGPPAVVMGAQVQLEPRVLRHVIEKRRRKIACDEDGERCNRNQDGT